MKTVDAFLKLLKDPAGFYRTAILRRIYNNSPVLKRLRKPSAIQEQFIEKLSRYKTNWDDTKKNVILTQTVSDLEMCVKLAAASNKLAKELNANIGIYTAEYFDRPKTAIGRYYSSVKFKTTLDKIFLSFAGKVIYRNNDIYPDQAKVRSIVVRILQSLKTKMDVIDIRIEDIKIGDLVYDTYLRYANRPQVDLKDPFLEKLIGEAVNIFYTCKSKLIEYNVTSLVTSYTTYTYHGIIVRLCLAQKIPVYSVGAYFSLVHKVREEYPSHANDHFLFHNYFQKLPDKEGILNTYRPQFEKRFEGIVDSATAYMKQSAFSGKTNPELNGLDWNKTVVILAHCFFDSPHIYRDLLFPDFYDWMNFTLTELLKQKDLTILVKQHPNGLVGNEKIFKELKLTYPTVRFIDKTTSQMQIINSRPKAVITAYGTAAAEFAYQGFPVVTIYDNPFTAYNFTHNANSIEEYRSLLADVMNLPPKQNTTEIIEYYYMQYFFFLRGYETDYLSCSIYKGQTSSDEFLEDYLPIMNSAYFEKLDRLTKAGFEAIEWEEINH